MSTTATYRVTGMTCDHCVRAVTDEMSAIPGVRDVEVDLLAGGDTTLPVVSEDDLSEDTVREAVDEAGYQLAGGTP